MNPAPLPGPDYNPPGIRQTFAQQAKDIHQMTNSQLIEFKAELADRAAEPTKSKRRPTAKHSTTARIQPFIWILGGLMLALLDATTDFFGAESATPYVYFCIGASVFWSATAYVIAAIEDSNTKEPTK